MKGVRVRGLKTFSGSGSDAVKSKFLPPAVKQHLFGSNNLHKKCLNEALNTSNSASSDVKFSAGTLKLPQLHGDSIQSHIHELSERHSRHYCDLLKLLAGTVCPPIPQKWIFNSGWTCYRDGLEPKHVDFPDEDALIFDAEVCMQQSFAPVLATAVSPSAWYAWVSPTLIQNSLEEMKRVFISDLVPLGNFGEKPRVVIGHYVCFDSARVQESYDILSSGLKFFDTMAAHVAVSGISDLQRYFILSATEKPEWAKLACGNSLSQLHLLYCGSNLDKTERDVFVTGSLSDIAQRFQELCTYCALDVKATHSVVCKLLPLYLQRFPHGATLSALLDISAMFVPVDGSWEKIVGHIKETAADEDKEVKILFQELAVDALKLVNDDKYRDDPWMWDQDWSLSRKKRKVEAGGSEQPEWYRKLVSQGNSKSYDEVGINVMFRRNISAKLLQLCWGSFPLHYEPGYGWGMLIPALKASTEQERNVPVESVKRLCESIHPRPRVTSVPSLNDFISLHTGITAANSRITSGRFTVKDKEEKFTQFFIQNGLLFKKLPHPLGLDKNVSGALSVHLLANQCLRSANPKAKRILEILRKNVFWKKKCKVFETLPIVWFDEELSRGAVVPSASACGDFVRHPKEMVFSSLCNEDKGSQGVAVSRALRAPSGWCFLSASIPQADLWMTALLADSKHGALSLSRIGQMFVEGTVYDSISEFMKTSPMQSELLFHAALWGANRKFIAKVLRDINPLLGESTLYERSDKLLEFLLGLSSTPQKTVGSGVLCDFQKILKEIADVDCISTPILQSRLSRVLESDAQKYFPLIQNWLVRSCVADYLHVLMLCFRDFVPKARLCTVSSQTLFVKYLIPEDEKFFAAKSLHTAHLYSAAFCAAQLGISDIPQRVAELPIVSFSSTIREDISQETVRQPLEEAFKI